MNIKDLSKYLVILFSVMSAIGCGENQPTPLALRKVFGVSDVASESNGSMSELTLRPDSLKPTLLDTVVKNGVPQAVATVAFAKYDQFEARVKKTDWVGVIDFTKSSGLARFFMINTATGSVDKTVVAHGAGSDPKNSGTPTRFSNTPNSKMSSLGAYIVNEKYHSPKHGTTARLDGLESTNSYARPRAIILHSASYVESGRSKQGMSWGCPAVSMSMIATALSRFSGGAFLYAYGPAQSHAFLDESRAQQMLLDPAFQWLNESEDAPINGVGGDE